MVSIWTWHIIAGLIGVILSLSAFYQRFEKAVSAYRKLDEKDVERIVTESGIELTGQDFKAFLDCYNRMIYMGKGKNFGTNYDGAVIIYLRSGERLQMVKTDRFYEVRRIKSSGKQIFFRLLKAQNT